MMIAVPIRFAKAILFLAAATASAAEWPMGGQNIANTSFEPEETRITPRSVGQLRPQWAATLKGDVEATPAVANGIIYFGGCDVNALRRTTPGAVRSFHGALLVAAASGASVRRAVAAAATLAVWALGPVGL